MKEIKLSQASRRKNFHLNLIALVDDEDYEYLNQWKWHVWINPFNKRNMYAIRNSYEKNIITGKIKIKGIKMHREIMGVPIGMEIDHVNGDGLNNQKNNLRICTKGENLRNKKTYKTKNRTSQYLGVSLQIVKRKTSHYWVSQIQLNGKKIYLKRFQYDNDGEKQAALTYNEAAIKYFGEFANLNQI